MKHSILNVNGEILKHPDNRIPRISVMDRAYLYGDSLYEVIRTEVSGQKRLGLPNRADV